jgi:SAM-dependent methyltransferase
VELGFRRSDLRPRYDVRSIREDDWHSYSELNTQNFIHECLSNAKLPSNRLLNAGCGGQTIALPGYEEIRTDLFLPPLVGRAASVCASVTALPFGSETFSCVICVGEVLGYCDPAAAIAEFARVLLPSGILICDFGSSISFRHRLTKSFGLAADMVIDRYNGAPEKIWIYNPEYICGLMSDLGFTIKSEIGTHYWSAVGRKFGLSSGAAVMLERRLAWLPAPRSWADLTTIAAVRAKVGSV